MKPKNSPYEHPFVRVLMAADASLAVVTAKYSGRKSRLWLWDTERDTFSPGQWLRGGLYPLDLSADGRHFAYYVAAPHQSVPHYLAVSRPPYLTALLFRPLVYQGNMGFREGEILWTGSAVEGSEVPGHPEYGFSRIEPGCPYLVRQDTTWGEIGSWLKGREARRPAVQAAVERFGWFRRAGRRFGDVAFGSLDG